MNTLYKYPEWQQLGIKMKIIYLGLLCCGIVFLTGCGQTGKLYLPPQKTAQTTN